MRTKTLNIYTFDELSGEQKRQAIDNYLTSEHQYFDSSDYQDSMQAFADVMQISINDYEISTTSHSYISWSPMHDGNLSYDLSGLRLRTYLINNFMPSFEKPKYYSTNGRYVSGQYIYSHRHSNCQVETSCPLTGFYSDNELILPILKFIDNPDNSLLSNIIDLCLSSFVSSWVSDMEYRGSYDYISEHFIANGYEFYADGSIA